MYRLTDTDTPCVGCVGCAQGVGREALCMSTDIMVPLDFYEIVPPPDMQNMLVRGPGGSCSALLH